MFLYDLEHKPQQVQELGCWAGKQKGLPVSSPLTMQVKRRSTGEKQKFLQMTVEETRRFLYIDYNLKRENIKA